MKNPIKKGVLKRVLLALVVLLVASTVLVGAGSAENTEVEPVAKIGTTEYNNLTAALSAVRNGQTIELVAGTYSAAKLLQVNPTGGDDSVDKGASQIDTISGGTLPHYTRTLTDVTIKGVDGTIVDGIDITVGHMYGQSGKPITDPITGTTTESTANSYYSTINLNNFKIESVNFTKAVYIGADYGSQFMTIDGFTMKDCNYVGNSQTNDNSGKLLRIGNSNCEIKNVLIDSCTVDTAYQGVYVQNVMNLTVQNCVFNNLKHNAIAVQHYVIENGENKGHYCSSGNIIIKDNIITNGQDRAIRFGELDKEGTKIYITGNAFTDVKDDGSELMKAESFSGVEVCVISEDNTWTLAGTQKSYAELLAACSNVQPVIPTAKIGDITYKSLNDAITAASGDATITLLTEVTVEDLEINRDGLGNSLTFDLNGYDLNLVAKTTHALETWKTKFVFTDSSSGTKGEINVIDENEETDGNNSNLIQMITGDITLRDVTMNIENGAGQYVIYVSGNFTLDNAILNVKNCTTSGVFSSDSSANGKLIAIKGSKINVDTINGNTFLYTSLDMSGKSEATVKNVAGYGMIGNVVHSGNPKLDDATFTIDGANIGIQLDGSLSGVLINGAVLDIKNTVDAPITLKNGATITVNSGSTLKVDDVVDETTYKQITTSDGATIIVYQPITPEAGTDIAVEGEKVNLTVESTSGSTITIPDTTSGSTTTATIETESGVNITLTYDAAGAIVTKDSNGDVTSVNGTVETMVAEYPEIDAPTAPEVEESAKVILNITLNADAVLSSGSIELPEISPKFNETIVTIVKAVPNMDYAPLSMITATHAELGKINANISTNGIELTFIVPMNAVEKSKIKALHVDGNNVNPVEFTVTDDGTNYIVIVKGSKFSSYVLIEDNTIVKEQSSSSSSSSGSSVWLQEPVEQPTQTPTEQPTDKPTDTVPTDIPSTQPTEEPASPGFGVLAVLAGLGAVAVLRRK